MNKYVRMLVLATLAMFALFSSAHAAGFDILTLATVPAEITELQTDMGTTWTSVKGVIIGFATFSLIMFVLWKVRRKSG